MSSFGSLTALLHLHIPPMNKDTATLPPLQLSHSSPTRDMADNMSIDKQDPTKEERESDDSMGSSPEGEAPTTAAAQENQQPKRKGGRKPVRRKQAFLHLANSPHILFLDKESSPDRMH